mmetsp:Transcript_63854/g.205748  ORF Transcript_63854/g.205748 Transcript_63854/m.205748 type:complete len:211 (-) Transcript_63854:802-1434(-)
MQKSSSSTPEGARRNVRAGVVGEPAELTLIPEPNGDIALAASPFAKGTWRKFELVLTPTDSDGLLRLFGLREPPLRIASLRSRSRTVPPWLRSMARKVSRNSCVSSGASSCARSCSKARRILEASAYCCRDRKASRLSDTGALACCPRVNHRCCKASCASGRSWASLLRSSFTKSMASSDTGFQRLLWLQSACPALIFCIITFSSPWKGG